jgi:hypothetical protein
MQVLAKRWLKSVRQHLPRPSLPKIRWRGREACPPYNTHRLRASPEHQERRKYHQAQSYPCPPSGPLGRWQESKKRIDACPVTTKVFPRCSLCSR